MNILEEIAIHARKRIEDAKKSIPLDEIMAKAHACPINQAFPFEKALKADGMAFICEVKKASPSKGIIAETFPYINIAKDYEAAGAAAISVLTEPQYFKGSNLYLQEIASVVSTPILRKDFTVDEYMIYEAACIGASAVLLICSLLDTATITRYIKIADSLGLSSLVEAHNEEEVAMALSAGVRIIGVNNRDLKTFTVDTGNSIRLRKAVPKDIIFVSESGIKTADDIKLLKNAGVDAVLIGETLMYASDKKAILKELRGE